MELTVGSVVYSKAGHDIGRAYVVLSISGRAGYVAVADGKKKTIASPKIKNAKHLRYKGEFCRQVAEKLTEGTLKDCDLIYYLKEFDREE